MEGTVTGYGYAGTHGRSDAITVSGWTGGTAYKYSAGYVHKGSVQG